MTKKLISIDLENMTIPQGLRFIDEEFNKYSLNDDDSKILKETIDKLTIKFMESEEIVKESKSRVIKMEKLADFSLEKLARKDLVQFTKELLK